MNFNYLKLKETRTKLGITQAEAAQYLKVARTTYADYERGRITPSLGNIKLFCDKFNVPLKDVLFPTNEETKERETDLLKLLDFIKESKLSYMEKSILTNLVNYILIKGESNPEC